MGAIREAACKLLEWRLHVLCSACAYARRAAHQLSLQQRVTQLRQGVVQVVNACLALLQQLPRAMCVFVVGPTKPKPRRQQEA